MHVLQLLSFHQFLNLLILLPEILGALVSTHMDVFKREKRRHFLKYFVEEGVDFLASWI